MKRIALLSVSLLLVVVSNVSSAQMSAPRSVDMNKTDMKSMDMVDRNAQSSASHSGTGVVKSVDAAAGSITLAHEPIRSLNWPAMTMGFKVGDKHLLDKVKRGDKVQFTLMQSGKDYVVTSIK